MHRCRYGKYWVTDFRTGVNVQPEMCGPGCCGREIIAVSLMLSRNEVAELSDAELIRLIRIQR